MPPPRTGYTPPAELDTEELDAYLRSVLAEEAPGEALDAPATTGEAIERSRERALDLGVVGPSGSPPPAAPGVEWIAGPSPMSGGTRYIPVTPADPRYAGVAEARRDLEERAALPSITATPESVEASREAARAEERATAEAEAREASAAGAIREANAADAAARAAEERRPTRVDYAAAGPVEFPDGIVATSVPPRARPAPMSEEDWADGIAAARAESDRTAAEAMAEANAADAASRAEEERLAAGPPAPETFLEGLRRGAEAAGMGPIADAADFWASVLGVTPEGEPLPAPPPSAPTAPAPTGPAVASSPRARGGARRGGAGRALVPGPSAPMVPAPPPPQGEASFLDRALGRNDEAARLARTRAASEAAGYADVRGAAREAEIARAENEAARRAAMDNARNRYRAAMERATAMTLDPEGWYHDRGVMGTIGAAIAIGMGSLGSGITGGTNEALGIINASIERDLEAQRTNIDQAHRRAEGEASLLDMFAAEFQSRDAAVAAARAAMLEDVANRVAEEAAGLSGEEAALAAREMHDQLIQQANAAALAAIRAEEDREVDLFLRRAQAAEAAADAARAARRAGGGSGAPAYDTPTEPALNAAARILATANENGRPMTAAEAYAAVGLDPSLAGDASRIAPARTGENIGVESALEASLARLDALVGPEGDIPGVGVLFDSHIPSAALDTIGSTGAEIREEMMNAADLLLRMRTGATAPTSEEQRLAVIAGFTGNGTEAAFRRGLVRMRRELDARRTGTIVGDPSEAARFGAGAGTPAED